MFLETSARTGENVEETFLKCARTILSKIESGKLFYGLPGIAAKLSRRRTKSLCSKFQGVSPRVWCVVSHAPLVLCGGFAPPSIGQLDPEKMGSGIQYGDSSLRKLAPREGKGGSCPC